MIFNSFCLITSHFIVNENEIDGLKIMSSNSIYSIVSKWIGSSGLSKSNELWVLLKNPHLLINWEESNILAKDDERNTKWIRESIWIRRKGGINYKRNLMNADEGSINLVIFMIS